MKNGRTFSGRFLLRKVGFNYLLCNYIDHIVNTPLKINPII
jgi:hypothetical protein